MTSCRISGALLTAVVLLTLAVWPALAGSGEAPIGMASIAAPAEAIDPVCGMTVRADASGRPFEHDGTTYYFCMVGCKNAFLDNPKNYLPKKSLFSWLKK